MDIDSMPRVLCVILGVLCGKNLKLNHKGREVQHKGNTKCF